MGYWKIGRVVEGTVLERRRARKGPKGSNPLSSATPVYADFRSTPCAVPFRAQRLSPIDDPVHEDRCHCPTDVGCHACGAWVRPTTCGCGVPLIAQESDCRDHIAIYRTTCGCGEMVDALVSDTSGREAVEVQVLSSAPISGAMMPFCRCSSTSHTSHEVLPVLRHSVAINALIACAAVAQWESASLVMTRSGVQSSPAAPIYSL